MRSLLVGRDHVGCLEHDPTKEAFIYLTSKVISASSLRQHHSAQEYDRRFGCEEGFRDAKWWLGFAKARIAQIKAWSRMFALFAIALLVMTSLGSKLLLAPGPRAKALLRRVVSRRRGR